MGFCCVPHCHSDSRFERDAGVSFYNVPQNRALQRRWIHAIRRDPGPLFSLKTRKQVCSKHFRRDDFKAASSKVIRKYCRLKPDSVPSIFPWSRKRSGHPLPETLDDKNFVRTTNSASHQHLGSKNCKGDVCLHESSIKYEYEINDSLDPIKTCTPIPPNEDLLKRNLALLKTETPIDDIKKEVLFDDISIKEEPLEFLDNQPLTQCNEEVKPRNPLSVWEPNMECDHDYASLLRKGFDIKVEKESEESEGVTVKTEIFPFIKDEVN